MHFLANPLISFVFCLCWQFSSAAHFVSFKQILIQFSSVFFLPFQHFNMFFQYFILLFLLLNFHFVSLFDFTAATDRCLNFDSISVGLKAELDKKWWKYGNFLNENYAKMVQKKEVVSWKATRKSRDRKREGKNEKWCVRCNEFSQTTLFIVVFGCEIKR